jgi:hypothetical protein
MVYSQAYKSRYAALMCMLSIFHNYLEVFLFEILSMIISKLATIQFSTLTTSSIRKNVNSR